MIVKVSLNHFTGTLRKQVLTLFALALVLWGFEFARPWVVSSTGGGWYALGIHPRQITGLLGILTAPLVHADSNHLVRNLLPLLVLSWLIMLEGMPKFGKALLGITLLSGAGIWALGASNTSYIGSSSLIYGFLAYCLARAWATRLKRWIIAGFFAAVVCGGLIADLMKFSSEPALGSHWIGFVAGIIVGLSLHRPKSFLDGGVPVAKSTPVTSTSTRSSSEVVDVDVEVLPPIRSSTDTPNR